MTTFSKTNLTAIILAGGQSSRMGQDKALLSIDGIALLTRTCNLALTVTTKVYVVTPWVERYQAIVPNHCQLLRDNWTEKHHTAPGPLTAFAQILPLITSEWVLLLACDLPFLTVDFLQDGSQRLAMLSPETNAFLARSPKGWEPLCGFYKNSCLASLQQFITQGGTSFQRWLTQLEAAELKLDNPRILFNCNSPEDLLQINN